MKEIRVENEIKMYSSGGPFSYEGSDPSVPMGELLALCSDAGFRHTVPSVLYYTDYYYHDSEGVFDREKILLRFRDMGDHAFLTMKMPTVANGMGLSRREIEGEIRNDSRFDRWRHVQDYAEEAYGPVEILKVPSLKEEVIRSECRISSGSNVYSFTFDKMVYIDPVSGRRSAPCYELEFEMIDKAIQDDPSMVRLLTVLRDLYMFEEERISKYARGMAFLRSLRS